MKAIKNKKTKTTTTWYVDITTGRVPGRHTFPTWERAEKFVREMARTGMVLDVHRTTTTTVDVVVEWLNVE